MKFLRNLLFKLFKKSLVPHKFSKGMLIHGRGNREIFEVEEHYYDTDLEPVTILTRYGTTQLCSMRNDALAGFIEYKSMPKNNAF